MILVWDIGNTNIVLGFAVKGEFVHHCRLTTFPIKTADDYLLSIRGMILAYGLEKQDIQGAVVSCVVPALREVMEDVNRRLTNHVVWVSYELQLGIEFCIESPHLLGADRLADVVAVRQIHQGLSIVVDFGTATTINVIDGNRFEGGLICAGFLTSAKALFQNASQLPHVPLEKPRQFIGTHTVESLQSGLFHGYVAMIEGLLKKMIQELQSYKATPPKIFATGGWSQALSNEISCIEVVDELLTLKGAYQIFLDN